MGKFLVKGAIVMLAFGVMILASLQAEIGLPATVQSERTDPVLTSVCKLTINGLEGNHPELKSEMFIKSSSYTVDMPRSSNPVGPPQGFVMTVGLSNPQASPLLMMAHASAVHLNQATLVCMNAALAPMYQWMLSDVVVTASRFPIEQISLTATKAEFADLVTHVTFTWDVKTNQGGVLTPAGPLQYVAPPPVKR